MKYVQSFYSYPVTFSAIGKGIPAKDADGELRNIAELTDEEVEKLEKQEPLFRALIEQKKYRVLNKLPESYKAPSTQINEANERAAKAEAELAALKAKMGVSETEQETKNADLSKMDYKELQALAKSKGIENVAIKKADLIKAIEEAK